MPYQEDVELEYDKIKKYRQYPVYAQKLATR